MGMSVGGLVVCHMTAQKSILNYLFLFYKQ